ncbi:MAG: cation diffusion facilitator family transporter [Candidatus Dormibacteraceae bacterium]
MSGLHLPPRTDPRWIILASSAIDLCLVLAKLVLGLLTGSLALISDAAHSGLDLIASILAFLAVRVARKPADQEHPYGHGRAENLAAYTTGILLLLAAAVIAYEAVHRLREIGLVPVEASVASLVFLVAALCLEACRATILRAFGRVTGSPGLMALATDKVADLFSVAGVLGGLVLVRLGISSVDSIAALLVAGLIAGAAIRLLKQSGDILIDRAATSASRVVILTAAGIKGVREVRSARVRQVGSQLMGDVLVTGSPTLSLEAVRGVTRRIEQAVAEKLPNLELTVMVEAGGDPKRLVERVHATAARNGSFQDLHDVIVEREADESLHLSLHAKLPGGMSMREAARLIRGFEQELESEFPEVSRVDIHLEPLEPDLIHGRNVTEQHSELVNQIRCLVNEDPRVEECQDIELSSRQGEITAHVSVRVPDDLSLDQAHRIASQLEELLRQAVSVDRIVVRSIA